MKFRIDVVFRPCLHRFAISAVLLSAVKRLRHHLIRTHVLGHYKSRCLTGTFVAPGRDFPSRVGWVCLWTTEITSVQGGVTTVTYRPLDHGRHHPPTVTIQSPLEDEYGIAMEWNGMSHEKGLASN